MLFRSSTVHQPSVTDSIGRFFEITLQGGTTDPALSNDTLERIGGNRYVDIYNNPFVLGSQQLTARQSTIFAPNYSVAATATNNPPITSIIERNIVGHAPETFLNNEWSGSPIIDRGIEPNQFPAGWQQNSYLPGGVFLFDDVGRVSSP